ncbi:MAG TPA: serine hydrolase domain-containing protein [Actinomycetota bacterium]
MGADPPRVRDGNCQDDTGWAIAPFSFVRAAPARADELERYLRRKLVEVNTPGIAVAGGSGGRDRVSAGVGRADWERRIRVTSDTEFQLASVSKTLTCAGIAALVVLAS